MARVPLQPSEVAAHLHEQLIFIRNSARAYDEGNASEAKRIATAVLNVVDDRGRNTVSIVTQLGETERGFYSSGYLNKDEHPGPGRLSADAFLVAVEQFDDDSPPRYIPILDDLGGRRAPFEEWKNEIVFRLNGGVSFSRLELLREMRDTDGGSHVDGALTESYDKLTRQNSLDYEVVVDGQPKLFAGAALAAVRQIGHEVLRSFGDPESSLRPKPTLYFAVMTGREVRERSNNPASTLRLTYPPELILDDNVYALSSWGPSGLSRNAPCFCGSGFRLKHCHARPVSQDFFAKLEKQQQDQSEE